MEPGLTLSAHLRYRKCMDSPLALRLVRGFLAPALRAADWRERWKCINRAAGVIVGVAIGEPQPAREAEGSVQDVEELVFGERLIEGDPVILRQLTDGLRKRVAEILVLLDVGAGKEGESYGTKS